MQRGPSTTSSATPDCHLVLAGARPARAEADVARCVGGCGHRYSPVPHGLGTRPAGPGATLAFQASRRSRGVSGVGQNMSGFSSAAKASPRKERGR